MLGRGISLFCLLGATAGWAAGRSEQPSFEKTVQPFVAKHCALCHNEKLKTGGLDLAAYRNTAAALQDRGVWERVLHKLKAGEMPPKGQKAPGTAEVLAVTQWIEGQLARLDRNAKPDPGRVTARRLNRYEYNNTIRDLLGVDFRPAEDFPADDSGYGFDNIGDVLSLSPVLMEQYLAAAEKIARLAIVAGPPPRPTRERFNNNRPGQSLEFAARHRFPAEGDYDLRAAVAGKRLPLKLTLKLDGHEVKVFEVEIHPDKPRLSEFRLHVPAGEHEIQAALTRDDSRPEPPPPPPGKKAAPPPGPPFVDSLEIRGPYDPVVTLPESHRRLFLCGHANGQHKPECARLILANLAQRAYRRPVAAEEVDRLAHLVEMAQKRGDSFERGIQVALEAVLVSPHFLFRIERDPAPADPRAVHRISEFEMATRLSYFLWSSMPDEGLFRPAEEQRLRKPGVLEAQVRRMLLDRKARALVDNFAGQWLELRNLETAKPDPARFPDFDDELRTAMLGETKLFFETIIREDRSILDFIDGKFTFLNERLARHYGIAGVAGNELRRVNLSGEQRSGVLTQASILTVTSYPNRTSPVLRGKWLLENILGDPPPPPPPDVPNLNEAAVGATGSLRQQLEQHRASTACAVCHARMDPLGFALENYDAIGAWRTRDGKFPIEASAALPNGKSFQGATGLKALLRADKDAFARCLTEKMLIYALGRGLERYDQPAVAAIARRLAGNGYRFSSLVIEIAKSVPFQMRRGDAGTAVKLASSREKR